MNDLWTKTKAFALKVFEMLLFPQGLMKTLGIHHAVLVALIVFAAGLVGWSAEAALFCSGGMMWRELEAGASFERSPVARAKFSYDVSKVEWMDWIAPVASAWTVVEFHGLLKSLVGLG